MRNRSEKLPAVTPWSGTDRTSAAVIVPVTVPVSAPAPLGQAGLPPPPQRNTKDRTVHARLGEVDVRRDRGAGQPGISHCERKRGAVRTQRGVKGAMPVGKFRRHLLKSG
jgi:hypothetical protein